MSSVNGLHYVFDSHIFHAASRNQISAGPLLATILSRGCRQRPLSELPMTAAAKAWLPLAGEDLHFCLSLPRLEDPGLCTFPPSCTPQ